MTAIIQRIWMVMAMLWLSISAFAYDFEVDGICYDITSFTELTVKASSVSESIEGTLTIPSFVEFKGKQLCVTTIGESFAENNNKINTLIIGDSIAAIESKAFKHCAEISSVIINGCTTIGSESFKGCSKINDIKLPASLRSIGDRGFEDCTSITNIDLPEQLKEIGSYAFNQCSSLIRISLPNIERIQDYTFYGCTALKNIDLSADLTSIGSYAFSGIAVDSFIIPNSVTFIGENILSNCANLQIVTIGSGVSRLSSNPVINCPKLRELRFVDSDTPLEITFNGEVIQSFVYRRTSVSSNVYVNVYNGGFQNLNIERLYLGRTVKYPDNDPSSNVYSTINTNPFTGNKYIKEITIGEKVKSLPFVNIDIYYSGVIPVSYSNAFGYFEGCEALEKIYIYGNLKDISDRMFYGTNINSIITPNTISTIGASAFAHCSLLQEVYIGKNCKAIGINAFSNCDALSILNLYCINPPSYSTGFDNSQYLNVVLNIPPNTIDEYQNYDPWKNFWNLKEDEQLLTEFIIEPLKYEISNRNNVCLVGFTDLEIDTLNIPSTVIYNDNEYHVTSLGFEGIVLNNCKKIYLSNSIKELPSAIFKEWINLKDVSLGDIEVINDNCFTNCKSLRGLIVPATCNSIGNDCFKGCISLENMQFDFSEHTITLGINTSLTLSSSITPFPNPSDVDERRTGFRNGYYDGLFYGLPIEHLVINRDIELPKYYARTMGNSTSSYSTVYNDIVYYPPFYGLTNLKYVEIGENVSAICKNQIEAVVNAVPTTMEYTNFGKCENVEVVVSSNSKAPIGGGFSKTVYEQASLFLPNGGIESYKNDDYWKNFVHINETSFIPIESISFESDEVTIDINASKILNSIINPSEASIKNLKWSSSNASVVTVSEDGVITSSSREGDVIITAMSCDGTNVSASIKIIVQEGAGIADVFADDKLDIRVENGKLHIRGKADTDVVSIYNVQGQLVLSTNDNEIELSTKGIYIIKVGSVSKKLTI